MGETRVRKETVSPDMARAWLGTMEMNRNLRESRVVELLADMKAGKWMDTAETIKFNGDGKLIDGQHRLAALIEYGKPLEFWVARDLPKDAYMVIDSTCRRSGADVLAMFASKKKNNWMHNAMRASCVTMIYHYDRTAGKSIASPSGLSHQQIVAAATKYDDMEQSLDFGLLASKTLRLGASVFAACHYILARQDEKKADEFFQLLISGENLKPGAPVTALRSFFVNVRMLDKRMTNHEIAWRIFYCWNATLNGEPMKKMSARYSSGLSLPEID